MLAVDATCSPLADVVDTNVPLVAKFPGTHPGVLVNACEELLEDIIEHVREVGLRPAMDVGRVGTAGHRAARPERVRRARRRPRRLRSIRSEVHRGRQGRRRAGTSSDGHEVARLGGAALSRHGVVVRYVHEESIRDA
jgi:hypothetical protein